MKYKAFRRRDYWKVAEGKSRITVSEYAKKYNYSQKTVTAKCRHGAIEALKFKGRWLILDVGIGG